MILDIVAALDATSGALAGPGAALMDALRRVRAALASGELPPHERETERNLTRALHILLRAELRPG